MIPDAPHILLLSAMKAAMLTVDYEAQAGVVGMKIRHTRNRNPVRGDRPCISILMVNDSPRQTENDQDQWETTRELEVDLQCDMDLPSEDSGDDPTGLAMLSRVLAAAIISLKAPGEATFLGGLADWITPGSIGPDDKSTPDDGRLVRGVTVLYRVRSDDSNVLLAAGENG